MIRPTIGRVVWLHRAHNIAGQPEVALVAFVHSDTCINVAGFDANGNHFSATSVLLDQGEGDKPTCKTHGTWAEWMPFQKGQAARHEAAAAAAAPTDPAAT